MKKAKHLGKTVLFGALAGLSAAVAAAPNPGPYVGATVGEADYDLAHYDEATSYSLLVGYQVNPYLAVEAAWLDLGEAKDDIPPRWKISTEGLEANVVGILPLTEVFSAYGKVGVYLWDAELSQRGFGDLESDDGEDLTATLGLRAAVLPNLDLNLEYKFMELDDTDVDNVAVGVHYRF